jgi:hypothetical protein
MNSTSSAFVRQLVGTVVAALIPVFLVAFVTIPFNLGHHPGEVRAVEVPAPIHLT